MSADSQVNQRMKPTRSLSCSLRALRSRKRAGRLPHSHKLTRPHLVQHEISGPLVTLVSDSPSSEYDEILRALTFELEYL